MAVHGWPFSQFQSTTLAAQLAAGIRVIDIRLAIVDAALMAFHGKTSQRVSFQQILSVVHTFLTSPASSLETVVMSIKQEDTATTPPSVFSRAVRTEILKGPGGIAMWYLENRVPMLGDARGKIVLLRRFTGDPAEWEDKLEGMGIPITPWPESPKDGFTVWCKETLVSVHDW
jgi:1-phosphatidylinositol phosphodiesterase